MNKTQHPKTLQVKRLLLSKNKKQNDLCKILKVKKAMISQVVNDPKTFPNHAKKIINYLKGL